MSIPDGWQELVRQDLSHGTGMLHLTYQNRRVCSKWVRIQRTETQNMTLPKCPHCLKIATRHLHLRPFVESPIASP